jgi:TnpA family transposase
LSSYYRIPFYSLPIECTDRDAAFVLDGLLYNESELEIEEHYTDTHVYTEINFAAFAMLGLRFSPHPRSPAIASRENGDY